jgi:hypothetical protein
LAEFTPAGTVKVADGTEVYADDPVRAGHLKELVRLLAPQRGGFPFTSGGRTGPRGAQGAQGAISSDIYAADRIVSLIPGEGTDLTIQAAIDNLPAGGGTIFVKEGVYPISTTILFPDKSIYLDFAAGAKVQIAANAIPLFKVQDIVTETRTYGIRGGFFTGGLVVGQELLRYDDSTGSAKVLFDYSDVRDFETLLNLTKFDLSYVRPAQVTFRDCSLVPPNIVTQVLAKTPNPAGTYAGAGVALIFARCMFVDYPSYSLDRGWGNLNFDSDIFFFDCLEVYLRGNSIANACDASHTSFENATVVPLSFEIVGGTYHALGLWDDVLLYTLVTFKFSAKMALSNIRLGIASGLIIGGPNGESTKISNVVVQASVSAISIDILAGADRCSITGGGFGNSATAAIRTAAQRTTIVGCTFASTGTNKTIIEAGSADRTLVTGCNGIGSGGGFTIPGASSLVGADNIG